MAPIPTTFGTAYETRGTISSSTNWDLNLTVDEAHFVGEDGTNNLSLNVVEFEVIETTGGASGASFTEHSEAPLAQVIDDLITIGSTTGDYNYGDNIQFGIQWRCGGSAHGGARIPGGTVAQRYTANIVLNLAPHN